jgi:hypothetical protein
MDAHASGLTRMPVGDPKMLSISYSPSAGAGSPGSCSDRSAIPCHRAQRAYQTAMDRPSIDVGQPASEVEVMGWRGIEGRFDGAEAPGIQ